MTRGRCRAVGDSTLTWKYEIGPGTLRASAVAVIYTYIYVRSLLAQAIHESKESRSYIDYDGYSDAFDGVCQLYEQGLKAINPMRKSITYDIFDIFANIDSLGDLCCLVFNPRSNSYVPHNREWISPPQQGVDQSTSFRAFEATDAAVSVLIVNGLIIKAL